MKQCFTPFTIFIVIPNSMQLVAGRTGQEYNQRKNRKGAYQTMFYMRDSRPQPECQRESRCSLQNLLAAEARLPKLISGEIRVKDAEKFLKERGL